MNDRYAIIVQGAVENRWVSQFEGLSVTPLADGGTLLAPIMGRQALRSVLEYLTDLDLLLMLAMQI